MYITKLFAICCCFLAVNARDEKFEQGVRTLYQKIYEADPNQKSMDTAFLTKDLADVLGDDIDRLIQSNIGYLTRPFQSDMVDESGALCVSEEEKAFYRMLSKQIKYRIPYRGSQFVSNNEDFVVNFRTCGTLPSHFSALLETQGGVQCLQNQDIYEIRTKLGYYELKLSSHDVVNADVRFVLFLNFKDDHATTLLSVLNPDTRQILLTVLINTWKKPSYVKFLAVRFNLKNGIPLCNGVRLTHYIPFADASLDLQLAEDDRNCALYSMNIVKALFFALQDTVITK